MIFSLSLSLKSNISRLGLFLLCFLNVVQASPYSLPESDDSMPGEGPVRRYEWFVNLWDARRAEFASQKERDQGAVVFLGDSITHYWGAGLWSTFPKMHVANRGISGDTTRGVLYRLEEDVLSLNPSAVVLLIGTNDLEEHAEPAVIAANVKRIFDRLTEANPEMPIILCDVFPSSAEKQRPADKIREINRLYRELTESYPQIVCVDTYTLFANEQGDATLEEFPDLLHPNGIGYRKWAAALLPVFETLGLSPVEEPFVMESGYRMLFNGENLDGWGYRVTTEEDRRNAVGWKKADPEGAADWPFVDEPSVFDGETQSMDGRFLARNGRIVVTIPSEHRKIQNLWTVEEFGKDFILKLEFRATPNADSGVYIRGPQLQCRDYLLAGPWTELKHYRPLEWNELVVKVRGTHATAYCNGELLAEMKVPESGPIGLEGDRGQMEYRRIRILEQ